MDGQMEQGGFTIEFCIQKMELEWQQWSDLGPHCLSENLGSLRYSTNARWMSSYTELHALSRLAQYCQSV